MRKMFALTAVFGAVVLALSIAFADHHEGAEVSAEAMPPMGPPPEMKEMEFKVGVWDVAMEMRQEAEGEFMTSEGVATFDYILDGAALRMTYTSTIMDMAFEGLSVTSFNRDTGEWTDTWIDNLGARMSIYHGKRNGDKLVFKGVDYMHGEKWLTRTSETPMKDGRFDWQLEHSTDQGKTWAVYMTCAYTKGP